MSDLTKNLHALERDVHLSDAPQIEKDLIKQALDVSKSIDTLKESLTETQYETLQKACLEQLLLQYIFAEVDLSVGDKSATPKFFGRIHEMLKQHFQLNDSKTPSAKSTGEQLNMGFTTDNYRQLEEYANVVEFREKNGLYQKFSKLFKAVGYFNQMATDHVEQIENALKEIKEKFPKPNQKIKDSKTACDLHARYEERAHDIATKQNLSALADTLFELNRAYNESPDGEFWEGKLTSLFSSGSNLKLSIGKLFRGLDLEDALKPDAQKVFGLFLEIFAYTPTPKPAPAVAAAASTTATKSANDETPANAKSGGATSSASDHNDSDKATGKDDDASEYTVENEHRTTP